MGTTYRGVYEPSVGETGWGDSVNANWTLLAGRMSDSELITTADHTVTNSVSLVADGELTFATTNDSCWVVELDLLYKASNTTGAYRGTLKTNGTWESNPASSWQQYTVPAATAPVVYQSPVVAASTTEMTASGLAMETAVANVVYIAHFEYRFRVVLGGAVSWYSANAVASSGRISTTVTGSRMRVKRIT